MRTSKLPFVALLPLPWLLACASEPPAVDSVTPGSGEVGTEITLKGAHLDGTGVSFKLGGKPLADAAVKDPGTVTATVPEGIKAGPVDLIVTAGDGKSRTLSGVFTVDEPPPEDPCDPSIKRMTSIPPTADIVKIDLYKSDDPEDVSRSSFPTRDIERIEYEARDRPDKGYCAAIWLKTKDGRQVLFDSTTTQELRIQAQKIANGLSRPLEVLHEDPLPEPEEEGGPEGAAGAAGAKGG